MAIAFSNQGLKKADKLCVCVCFSWSMKTCVLFKKAVLSTRFQESLIMLPS